MGTECEGTVTVGGQKMPVQADFASDHVTFHGGRRGQVKYAAIEVVSTGKGWLRMRVDGHLMEFRLGDKTERIAAKIRKPPTRLEKLGVKAGSTVALAGLEDKRFRAELEAACDVVEGLPSEPVDVVFAGMREATDLESLGALAGHIHPEGAVWVVYPKGKRELSERMVLEAGREAGFKDVKVVRFSESQTALKFVLPLTDR